MLPFTDLIDLASERLGGSVVAANDEFFAPKEALLKPAPPEWKEGLYTERGKWMDGWETRRRREPGYDWAIIRLGAAGYVRGVVVDTSWFTGNYPERASIDVATEEGTPSLERLTHDVLWTPLIGETPLSGNVANEIAADSGDMRITHLRLNIFPDGGVARLRAHGVVAIPPTVSAGEREVDLAAMENGGFVVACSDMHYGHRQNLILPGRSTHMGDGWETKRRRGPGNDWSIVRLATRGQVNRVEIDTDHFKGNAPGSCMLECHDAGDNAQELNADSASWSTLVASSAVQPHARHVFDVVEPRIATHVRLNIYPDGGVARLRLIGTARR